MSEERIKERCKREDIALKIVKGFLKKDCYTDTELEYSLNTLLDLYDKQKEEIQSLTNQLDFIGEQNRYIERQTIYLNKLEKELQGERIETEKMQKNYEAVIDKMEYEIGYDYISKNKVRDKIKELEEKEKNCNFTGLITECEIKIETLKELLEEN